MVTVTPGGGVPAPEGTPIPINKPEVEQAPVVKETASEVAPPAEGADVAAGQVADEAALQQTKAEIADSGAAPPAEVVAQEETAPPAGLSAAEHGLGGNFAAAEAGIGDVPPVESAPTTSAEVPPPPAEPVAPVVEPAPVAPPAGPVAPPPAPESEEMPNPAVVGADGAYDAVPPSISSVEPPQPPAAENETPAETNLADPELEEAKQLMVEKPGDFSILRDFRAILRSRVSRIEEIQALMARIKTPALKDTLGMNLVDAKEGLPRLTREIKRLENTVESSSNTGGQG